MSQPGLSTRRGPRDRSFLLAGVGSEGVVGFGGGRKGDWPHTVDGCEIHFAPQNETMAEASICWYLQGNHQKPAFLRWCKISSTVCGDFDGWIQGKTSDLLCNFEDLRFLQRVSCPIWLFHKQPLSGCPACSGGPASCGQFSVHFSREPSEVPDVRRGND